MLIKNLATLAGVMAIGVGFAAPANAISFIGETTQNMDGSIDISTGGDAVSDTGLENFFGLSDGTLNSLLPLPGGSGVNATEGSAFSEQFEVSVGDILSFDWEWNSNEDPGTTLFSDFAFGVISSDVEVLASTIDNVNGDTGTFSWVSTIDGLVTFGAGAVDVTDSIFDSVFTVSNLEKTEVPEPSAVLALVTVAGLAAASRRKVKSASSDS